MGPRQPDGWLLGRQSRSRNGAGRGIGKCMALPADKEVTLQQFSTMTGFEANLPWNIHRWCSYWGRGI